MIVSFVNQKGGVGKSTLSFHFACWLKEKGYSVSFYDADAQRSSSAWLKGYKADIPLDVIDPSDTDKIPDQVLALAENTDFTICDGPGGLGEITRTLLVLSDVAIFPITPSFLDATSLLKARSQLKYANSLNPGSPPKARILLNRTRKRSRLEEDMRGAESQLAIKVFKASIRELDAFRVAASEKNAVWKIGRSGFNATKDLEKAFDEIMKLVPVKQKRVANG